MVILICLSYLVTPMKREAKNAASLEQTLKQPWEPAKARWKPRCRRQKYLVNAILPWGGIINEVLRNTFSSRTKLRYLVYNRVSRSHLGAVDFHAKNYFLEILFVLRQDLGEFFLFKLTNFLRFLAEMASKLEEIGVDFLLYRDRVLCSLLGKFTEILVTLWWPTLAKKIESL